MKLVQGFLLRQARDIESIDITSYHTDCEYCHSKWTSFRKRPLPVSRAVHRQATLRRMFQEAFLPMRKKPSRIDCAFLIHHTYIGERRCMFCES